MSFRHPFITDYIYQASDEVVEANKAVKAIFKEYADRLDHVVDERGYGYYAGMFRGSSVAPSEYKDIEEMVYKLRKATKLPFRLTIMYESELVATYMIDPL